MMARSCDRRRRFDPLDPEIGRHLAALIGNGVVLGIAAGRGRSAGAALRAVLPQDLWSSVLVGYYNGSIVSSLDNFDLEADPEPGGRADVIAERLAREDFRGAAVEARRSQVTLALPAGMRPEPLVRRIVELVSPLDPTASVSCSSYASGEYRGAIG
jgi:hypothetical protein